MVRNASVPPSSSFPPSTTASSSSSFLPSSRGDLHKVRIWPPRRLRPANGGGSGGGGDPHSSHPQLEDLAAQGPRNRRARFRLQFPQLALRRRLGQLSCMSKPTLKLRSWPLAVLYYLLPFGALKPLTRVRWKPMSRVSTCDRAAAA
ncbi:phosphatidylserine decarboxylase proenzyme, mitochondrial-like [Sceloporus undulatus]|uniref:phosphatidylserine decarboxylase proenzyme, mitochondrial-like n=1 Tax=Sceloporus undulatus TaxID=8520 RepID=UPI001C4B51F7|nr:phosphatidylserine decarboxylase proenzyme, mitochondrial-like [Sceloporus undulatus]